MQLKQRINAFIALGKFLAEVENTKPEVLKQAEAQNGWFTEDNIKFSLKNWSQALSEDNIKKWVENYNISSTSSSPKTVAVIMAGNVPLVGFHDFLSVLITGNKIIAKLSSNDKILLPFIASRLIKVEPNFKSLIEFTDKQLQNFDAVIATGSDNTARYFEYYFSKYPNIIRKNRNSVAVLTGEETMDELEALANDIFRYFGLGCRNVSKLYLPQDYNFEAFFKAMYSWKAIINNNKYINNYDYNKAVYLMDSFPLLDNEFMLLKEDSAFSSPISVVFYEKYSSIDNLKIELAENSSKIQCVVSNANIKNKVAFGETQSPALWDYADGVDTVDFLLKISE